MNVNLKQVLSYKNCTNFYWEIVTLKGMNKKKIVWNRKLSLKKMGKIYWYKAKLKWRWKSLWLKIKKKKRDDKFAFYTCDFWSHFCRTPNCFWNFFCRRIRSLSRERRWVSVLKSYPSTHTSFKIKKNLPFLLLGALRQGLHIELSKSPAVFVSPEVPLHNINTTGH